LKTNILLTNWFAVIFAVILFSAKPLSAQINFTWSGNCINNPTQFIPTGVSIPSIATWHWTFGDGNASSMSNPIHTYAQYGTFMVTLSVVNTSGIPSSVSHTVSIYPHPVVGLTANTACFGDTTFFNLYGNNMPSINYFFWDYGDGTYANINNPYPMYHIYPTYGTYMVTLSVVDTNGCEFTVSYPVEVRPKPTAFFAYDTPACISDSVNFIDLSTTASGLIVRWTWDFGDGFVQTVTRPNSPNVTHLYSLAGTYGVTLTVKNSDSCENSFTTAVTIHPLPVVDFTYSGSCLMNPTLFTPLFNPASIANYLWDFGDGATSALNSAYHIYIAPGIYNVSLTVTDTLGCTNSITKPVTINPLPTAHFTAGTLNCSGGSVAFNDLSTTSAGYIVNWHWDFGDGNSVSINFPANPDVMHEYASTGSFTVSLTVITSDSCANTETQLVTIQPAPVAAFSFLHNCSGTPVQFTDLSQAGGSSSIVQWHWDFGDPNSGASNSSNLQNPVHIFSSTGLFNVQLIVTNSSGCVGTTTTAIDILSSPIAHFTFSTPQLNQAVQFTDQSVSNSPVMQWDWSFGDGNTASVQNPSHSYTIPGNYTVTLIVTDVNGCSGTTDSILILPPGANNITLTGKVFAGSNTINDAVVRLIMIDSSGMPVSELKTFPGTNNEFVFQNIPEGNYYLHAYPFVNSPVAPSFLPTFYINSVFWQTATLINLGQAQNPYDIHLATYSILIGGTFVINGQLVNNGKSMNTAEQEVLLFDNQNNPIRWTITDSDGGFSFDSLPAGTYSVNPVLAGPTTYPFYVVLNENTSPVFVKMIISGQTITSIQKPVAAPDRCKVFPNPASESITISCDKVMKKIIISNSLGEILLEVNNAATLYQADVSSFPSGIYFIRVITASEEFKIKAVVNH
jgi:PKD repeat protein